MTWQTTRQTVQQTVWQVMPEGGKEHLLYVSHTLQEMYMDIHRLAWVNPADVGLDTIPMWGRGLDLGGGWGRGTNCTHV